MESAVVAPRTFNERLPVTWLEFDQLTQRHVARQTCISEVLKEKAVDASTASGKLLFLRNFPPVKGDLNEAMAPGFRQKVELDMAANGQSIMQKLKRDVDIDYVLGVYSEHEKANYDLARIIKKHDFRQSLSVIVVDTQDKKGEGQLVNLLKSTEWAEAVYNTRSQEIEALTNELEAGAESKQRLKQIILVLSLSALLGINMVQLRWISK